MRMLGGFLLLLGLFACNGDDGDKDSDVFVDLDEDGYGDSEDCDDNDPDVNPGKAETCDEKDNDCDDAVDENVTRTFYVDADVDGYGDANNTTSACEQVDGLASNSADCNDDDATVYPGADEICDDQDNDCDDVTDEGVTNAYFTDADLDGYGDPDAPIDGCEPGDGIVDNEEDCDDDDDDVNPESDEVCDEVDNDCDDDIDEDGALDARTWYADDDGDEYGDPSDVTLACDQPDGFVSNDNDCDDEHDDAYPDATEYCDGYDNDCDDDADEDGAADAPTWYIDNDGDTFGVDDTVTVSCGSPGSGWSATDDDCDDDDEDINPDADEYCDEVDNDCDGDTDENGAVDAPEWYIDGDTDGYGNASVTTNACDQPSGYVSDDNDCNDSDAGSYPGADEYCDGGDNDCDSSTDEGALDATTYYADSDKDSYGDPDTSQESCSTPTGYTTDDNDCDDSDASIKPGANEYCDDVDEDCDGTIDESAIDSKTYYADADGDGYGDGSTTTKSCDTPSGYVSNAQDCDDTDAEINPDTIWYYDGDNDSYGDPSNTRTQCAQPGTYWVLTADDCRPSDASSNPGADEVCFDSVDNNCDGTADEDCPTSHCGYISSDETWSSTEDHTVTCDVYVCGSTSPELTIEDGVTVEFQANTSLRVGTCGNGSLDVQGTGTGVVFTSDEGSASAAGDWGGVYFGSYDYGSTLDGLTVEYAGGSFSAAIYLYFADITISDSVVQFSSSSGIYSYYSNLLMTGTTVADNDSHGVNLDGNSSLETSGGPTFTSNQLTGNAGYPLVVPGNYVGQLDASSTFTGNDDDYVYVRGDYIDDDATWQALDVDYYINGTQYVQGSSRPMLTIEDGASLYFESATALYVGNSSYGSLDVVGSGSGVLFSSYESTPSNGDWYGITIGYYDDGTYLEGATVEYGGGNGYGGIYTYYADPDIIDCTVSNSSRNGIYVNTGSYPYINGTTVRDNDDDGIYIYTSAGLDTSSTPGFFGNTMTDNGGYPIRVPANYVGELDATSSFSGNGTDHIYIVADTVDTDATWQYHDADYYLSGAVYVQGSARPELTLEAGSTFYVNYSTDFYVGNSSYGTLYAEGTASLPITFTSIRSTPRNGDWDGITLGYYDSGSVLSNTIIEYAGGNGSGNLYMYYSEPELDTVTSTHSTVHGAYATYATPYIHDSEFSDNDNSGLIIYSTAYLDTNNTPGFTDNLMDGNGDYPMAVPANYLGELDDSSSFSGNGDDVIYVYADVVDTDATWQTHDVPYFFAGTTQIYGSSRPVVSIGEGAELQFDSAVELHVGNGTYGGLEAIGSSTSPVVFTSGEASPSKGDWRGIRFGYYCQSSYSTLSYATIEYGGGNGYGNVMFYYCSGTIENSTSQYSSSYGVYRLASSPTVSNVTYASNSAGDLY